MNELPLLSELAALPEKALIDERTLAAMFHVSPRTITRWIARGALPSPARLGGRRLWMAASLVQFIEQQLVAAENSSRRQKEATKRAETP